MSDVPAEFPLRSQWSKTQSFDSGSAATVNVVPGGYACSPGEGLVVPPPAGEADSWRTYGDGSEVTARVKEADWMTAPQLAKTSKEYAPGPTVGETRIDMVDSKLEYAWDGEKVTLNPLGTPAPDRLSDRVNAPCTKTCNAVEKTPP